MKKLCTLALGLLLAVGANAQSTTRKTWDFRKGFSAVTFNNLAASGSSWGDNNTATPSTVSNMSFYSPARTAGTQATCKVNGEDWVIPETEGLIFGATSAKHLNLYYDSSKDESGFVWVNGGKAAQDYVIIPAVPAGDTVTVIYNTHKNTEARGFKISTDGFADKTGQTSFTTMQVDTVVIKNSNSSSSDLKLTATNGMHFDLIQIGEGDPKVETKIGFIYDSSATGYTLAADPAYTAVSATEGATVVPIDVAGDISSLTATNLEAYSTLVLSSTIPSTNGIVSVLKDNFQFVPTLNLNASLYDAWGYGKSVSGTAPFSKVKKSKDDLFSGLSESTFAYDDTAGAYGLVLSNTTNFTGVKPGEYFAGDDTLAVDMKDTTLVAIHKHNIYHNGYIYLPFNQTMLADDAGADAILIKNAISALVDSKEEVSQTAVPNVQLTYKDMQTIVTLKDGLSSAKIYYTTDGTDATVNSTLYTGPFTLTEASTVKAIAIANGYTLSDMVTTAVDIKHQAKVPTISVVQNGTQATVTMSSDEAVDIWYNINGYTDSLMSTKYTQPLVLSKHVTITAFAVGKELVQSESVTTPIVINNEVVRMDPVSHFDASSAEWNGGSTSTKYYFTWGKNAVTIYDESQSTVIKAQDGVTDSVIYTVLKTPSYFMPATPATNKWRLSSLGQVLVWESGSPATGFVNDKNDYYPATALDQDSLITKYKVTFGVRKSGEPYTDIIQTTEAISGPFDIVTYAYNANADYTGLKFVLQVNADSTKADAWTVVGDTCSLNCLGRNYQKFTRAYESETPVYVRLMMTAGGSKLQIPDIYIMKDGDISEAYKKSVGTGLNVIESDKGMNGKVSAVYSINGLRQKGLQHGINIVKYADGSVKKVLMK